MRKPNVTVKAMSTLPQTTTRRTARKKKTPCVHTLASAKNIT